MHDRDLQVLLQQRDDVERTPARAQHVDRIRALMWVEEVALDMRIDLLAGEILHLVERHLDAIHAAHDKSRVAEILGKNLVEPGAGK